MIEKLMKLAENSYSPYSHYRVATIVVMKDGKEFVGVNVENSAYGSSICAERSAILAAISNGYKKGDFKEMHCLCADSNKISTSCFGCRQVIVEFFELVSVTLLFVLSVSLTVSACDFPVESVCTYGRVTDAPDHRHCSVRRFRYHHRRRQS